ncbi:MAG: hypothetical protein AABZ47_18280 [Planctomycetota bacterium]
MDQHVETCDGVVVPAPAALERWPRRYGSIADLPDEELADPEELERQVFFQEWGPILALPVRRAPRIRADIDENGGVEWGAFGTVDFERISPKFDKARYKADKLKEELRNLMIMIDTVRYHVKGPQKNMVLKYALRGIIDVDDILNEELRALANLFMRARRIRQEIDQLEEARWRRKQREAADLLARLG